MKMFERLQAKKKDNKGFSLVELIIVIAIMAILVGVVGTQVVPYLNKSKVAKDQQLLSAYATAAVSAYSYVADKLTETGTITINVFGSNSGDAAIIKAEMDNLINYDRATLKSKMSSVHGKSVDTNDIVITMNQSHHTVLVHLNGTGSPAVPDAEATL